MIVVVCPTTVPSATSTFNPRLIDGRHDEGSHEPIPPVWTYSACWHRWRPFIHSVKSHPLVRRLMLDGYLLMICDDIHLLVWIVGLEDVHHIVNSSVNSTQYYIPKRESKLLPQNPEKLHFFGIHLLLEKKKKWNSKTRMQISAAKPHKRIPYFFLEFATRSDIFFFGNLPRKRHFLLCYLPILSYA